MRGVIIGLILIVIGIGGCTNTDGQAGDTPLVPMPSPPLAKAYPIDINFSGLSNGPLTGTVPVGGVDITGSDAVINNGNIELNPGPIYFEPPSEVSQVAVMVNAQSQSSIIMGLDRNSIAVSQNFTWKLGDFYFFTISSEAAVISKVQVSGPDCAVQRAIFSNPFSVIDFQTGNVIPMASSASDMVVADLDNDGKTDIAVASPGDLLIHVGYGNGTGGIARDETILTVGAPGKISAADLDGDTFPELVATLPGSSELKVFKNLDGSYDAGTIYGAGTTPAAIAIADVNNAGGPDIAIAGTDGIGILLNDGSGAFGALQPVPGLAGPALDVALADLDLDDKTDLIIGLSSSIQVWRGDGAGGFTAPGPTLTIQLTPQTLKNLGVRALDWDKYPDIVATFTTAPNFRSWLYDKSAGTFTASQAFNAVSGTAADLVLADINADGFADMVIADGTTGKLAIYVGLLMGQFQPVKDFGDGPSPMIIRAGDLNGDRSNDIVTLDSSGTARVYMNGSH